MIKLVVKVKSRLGVELRLGILAFDGYRIMRVHAVDKARAEVYYVWADVAGYIPWLRVLHTVILQLCF